MPKIYFKLIVQDEWAVRVISRKRVWSSVGEYCHMIGLPAGVGIYAQPAWEREEFSGRSLRCLLHVLFLLCEVASCLAYRWPIDI